MPIPAPAFRDDKLKEIFETFYTTKPQGTGLGLSIARTIIETYGGRIWAENQAGGGAVFPLHPAVGQDPDRHDETAEPVIRR